MNLGRRMPALFFEENPMMIDIVLFFWTFLAIWAGWWLGAKYGTFARAVEAFKATVRSWVN